MIKKIISLPIFKALLCIVVVLCFLGAAVLTVSLSVKASMNNRIISADEAALLEDVDYVLVLGAGLRADGSPSDMLADRLKVGVSLMKKGFCDKLLLSGDNSGDHYNEVGAMHDFAVANGIDESKIINDGKGFSTYESIYNALKDYGAKKIVIVTQEYHLYRALYIARAMGIEAYGVHADLRTYRGQGYREIREHFARIKGINYDEKLEQERQDMMDALRELETCK